MFRIYTDCNGNMQTMFDGMKTLLVVLFFSVNLTNVFSQSEKDIKEKDIPLSIKKYIKEKYTGVGKINYYTEAVNDSSFYEASFIYKKEKYDLLFKMDGGLYETEREMKFEELPITIRD